MAARFAWTAAVLSLLGCTQGAAGSSQAVAVGERASDASAQPQPQPQTPVTPPATDELAPPSPEPRVLSAFSEVAADGGTDGGVSQLDDDDDAGVDPPPRVIEPHPPGNDLTYPCLDDRHCNYGSCFVPGRGDDNPICSKPCHWDADCPDAARCALPYECLGVEGPCASAGLCFRSCTTDAQCTAFNEFHTGPDAPHDANPVACVAWVPIHDDWYDDPNAPEPPSMDICIQTSEP